MSERRRSNQRAARGCVAAGSVQPRYGQRPSSPPANGVTSRSAGPGRPPGAATSGLTGGRLRQAPGAALSRGRGCRPANPAGRARKDERRKPGQAIVEAAIIIPILLLLIFGAIDAVQIALANYQLAQATEAAVHQAALIGGPAAGETREGSLASAHGSIAEQARLILDAGLGTSAEQATIHIVCQPVTCPRYAAITVEITYRGEVWAPLGPFGAFTASSTLTRATEQDRGFISSTAPPPTSVPYPGGGTNGAGALQIPGAGGGIPGSRPERAEAKP